MYVENPRWKIDFLRLLGRAGWTIEYERLAACYLLKGKHTTRIAVVLIDALKNTCYVQQEVLLCNPILARAEMFLKKLEICEEDRGIKIEYEKPCTLRIRTHINCVEWSTGDMCAKARILQGAIDFLTVTIFEIAQLSEVCWRIQTYAERRVVGSRSRHRYRKVLPSHLVSMVMCNHPMM